MAGQSNLPEQYNLVYTLGVQPGIKRDGTVFESREFSDGEWCRFQRGTPKKMGGYRELFATFTGIPRGMITNSFNGVNYVFVGNEFGLEVFTTGTTFGVGSGPLIANIKPGYAPFTLVSNTTAQFVIAGDVTSAFPNGTSVIFSQTTPVVRTVTGAVYSAPNTTVTVTGTIAGSPTTVWLYDAFFQSDSRLLWQFDIQYSPLRQGQFDALHSLCFNIGEDKFKQSTVVRKLNEGDYQAAADAILLWNHPPEIQKRRKRERALFLADY